jgi:hypothetical protein
MKRQFKMKNHNSSKIAQIFSNFDVRIEKFFIGYKKSEKIKKR